MLIKGKKRVKNNIHGSSELEVISFKCLVLSNRQIQRSFLTLKVKYLRILTVLTPMNCLDID